ncbi:hypothetical protein ES703_61534 [subsurface metagenome]
MDTKKTIWRIAGLSFTCALFFYIFIHDGLLAGFSIDPPWMKLVIEVLSAMGFYLFVFEIFFWFYIRYFYRIFDRRLDIKGEWYQIFVINQYSSPIEAIRYGPCKVVSSYEGVSISGENYRVNQEFSSSWQSEVSTITGDKLILIYISEGIRRQQNYITRGTMSYHIYGLPPTKLVGNFSDSTPATHSGPIMLFKDKSAYEERLASLIKSAEEAKETSLLSKALNNDKSSI